ncbi:PREDICTED: interactor of constitutive active ROPs 2, chloroplastic [Tarenaya hassleriana]|uniref:interactor of constitutive active ROPs 2, chloroplastic n=1 Tax=Tarenaya hassleriana TaxID=28532 RepID=UPI00053CA378|nr:PREDICTED: interactor of constitutive active ROPs 2, chloroplastic [Tarenaya hassleriana]
MQTTPKARPGSLEVPQKKSPATARRLKTESDSVSSPNPKSRTPKSQSPKVLSDRRSPRTPVSEIPKKRIGKIPEMESRIAQLQEELKKAKEQLNMVEASKRKAEEEAEERKRQLMEITASEDSRIDELRKLSQERDKVWQSELEAMQRQHSMDTAALSSAMNEIQKLKAQQLSEPEVAPQTLVEDLRIELGETLPLVETLRGELFDAKEAEARAQEFVSGTEKQLEIANLTLEMLRSDAMKMSEVCNSMETELELSKSEIRSLEELVKKLESGETGKDSSEEIPGRNEEVEQELNLARNEINQLKSALEVAETRYHEEYIQSTLQIRSAYEQVEVVKLEYLQREAKLEEEMKIAKAEIEALRGRLMDKEAKLRIVADENEALNARMKENEEKPEFVNEIKTLESEISDLKANLMDKEMELQSVTSQNEALRAELEEIECEKDKIIEEALTKLGNVTDEAGKSRKKAENATEQLGAAQATNAELETELRRLKVQCDQWRKAAEAAASMITGGNENGKFVERTGSMESPLARNLNVSPFLDDTDDELSPKKKNGNMLKKIGVLLKKSQK